MRLLNPAALWLLVALPIIFLLPRLRLPRARRLVANVYMWRPAETGEARLIVQLRKYWHLLLQAAIVALLALAVARPMLTGRASNVAIVLDVSASMAARSGERTRFDDARNVVAAIVRELPRGPRIRLVTAGDVPADHGVVDGSAVVNAVARLSPGTGSASLEEAIATARAASGNDTVVHVITDSAEKPVAGVAWHPVGAPADNLAITALAVRRLPSSPLDAQLLLQVQNFTNSTRTVAAEAFRGDISIVREQLVIPAGGTRTIVRAVSGPGGVFRATIDANDALAADNARQLTSRAGPIPVLVVAREDDYVTAALEVNPSLEVRRATIEEVERAAGPGVVVCDPCSRIPKTDKGLLILAPATDGARTATLTIEDQDHPVTQGIALDGVAVTSPGPLDVAATADVIARAGRAPAIVAAEQGGRRSVTVLFDVSGGGFPFQVAFPLLVANAVDWLAAPETAAGDLNVPTVTESDLRMAPSAVASAGPRSTLTVVEREAIGAALLIALVLLVIEWQFVGRRNRGVRSLRLVALLLVAAAAANPRIPGGRAPLSLMFVLDRSDSVPLREQQRAAQSAAAMSSEMSLGDRAGTVVLAGEAVVDRPLATRGVSAAVTSTVPGGASNIEAGLRTARAALGASDGVRRIVLFTDGRETTGNAVREATIARASGVAIDVVPASDSAGVSSSIVRVVAPADVRSGEPFRVSADVVGARGAKARVAIARDGVTIRTADAVLDAAGTARVSIDDALARAGAATYTAWVVHGDGAAWPEAGAVVVALVAPSVLHVSPGGTIGAAAASAGIRVVRVAPSGVPPQPGALATYDAVILENVSASDLTSAQSAAVANYVEQLGGGLLVAGDARSLGPAGYPGTPIGTALPVDLRRRSGTRAPDLSLAVVFDKSGSMADRVGPVTKLELARRSVMSVAEVLAAGDRLAVFAFDSDVDTIAPLGAGLAPGTLRASLEAVTAGGSTAIAPAVEAARAAFRAAPQGRRQVLLISDGRSSEADAARVMELARTREFELSIVAIGDDADRVFFQRLADVTGARVYFPPDVTRLPDIVAREAARSSGGWRVDEPFVPRAGMHPILAAVDTRTLPMLDGYVVGAPRPTAEAILTSHLGDPVFSAWRFGLGRVALFNAGQSDAFRGSPVSATLWKQSLRWLGRPIAQDVQVATRRDGDQAFVGVEARRSDGSFDTSLLGNADIRTPGGSVVSLPLRQVAPGRYESSLATAAPGTYLATVSMRADDGTERRARRGFYWAGTSERAAAGADRPRLLRIAETSGGRLLSAGDNPFTAARPRAWRPVRTWLATAALLVFMVELLERRGLRVRDLGAIAWRKRARETVVT